MKNDLLKSFTSRSYNAMILYDILLVLGIITIPGWRIILLLVLIALNALYFMAKNYKVIDVYQDKLVLYVENVATEVTRDKLINYEIVSNGLPALKFDILDDDQTRSIVISCPNCQEIFGFLNKYYLEKNLAYKKEEERLKFMKEYEKEHSLLNRAKKYIKSFIK